MAKVKSPRRRNQAGAQPGHTGHRRPLSELKPTDTVICCLPDEACAVCSGHVELNPQPTSRHQVFELPKAALDITEYQLFHGRCQHCHHSVRAALPADAPSGQTGPRLMSYMATLAGQCHLSISNLGGTRAC